MCTILAWPPLDSPSVPSTSLSLCPPGQILCIQCVCCHQRIYLHPLIHVTASNHSFNEKGSPLLPPPTCAAHVCAKANSPPFAQAQECSITMQELNKWMGGDGTGWGQGWHVFGERPSPARREPGEPLPGSGSTVSEGSPVLGRDVGMGLHCLTHYHILFLFTWRVGVINTK